MGSILLLLNATLSNLDAGVQEDPAVIRPDRPIDIPPDVTTRDDTDVQEDVDIRRMNDHDVTEGLPHIAIKEGKAAVYIQILSQSEFFSKICRSRFLPTLTVEPSSTFDAAEVLGSAYPWRCIRQKRRTRNPPHYHLVKKALKAMEKSLSEKVEPPSRFGMLATIVRNIKPWRLFRQKQGRTLRHPRYRNSFSRTRFPRRKRKKKRPRVVKDPYHWKHLSEAEILDNYERNKHKYLHLSSIQYEARFGINLDAFTRTLDPFRQFRLLKEISDPLSMRCQSDTSDCAELKKKLSKATSEASTLVRALGAARVQSDSPSAALKAATLVAKAVGAAAFVDNFSSPPVPLVAPIHGSHQSVYLSANSNTPMVIDTGASMSLTPHRGDFKGTLQECSVKEINGLNGTSRILGKGIVEWTVRDIYGQVRTIRTEAYLVEGAQIRLFSPQQYFMKNQAGSLLVDHRKTTLTLPDKSVLEFPYQSNNIPIMLEEPTANVAGLTIEDVFYIARGPNSMDVSVTEAVNQNLTAPEKERLLYHQKLGHAHLQWIERLMAQPQDRSKSPILPTRCTIAQSGSRRHILCAACQLAKQARRTFDDRHTFDDTDMAIRSGDLQPGDKVSIDQYQSTVPGRLPHTRGKEKQHLKYVGGTIFCDHASGAIFVVHQTSLSAEASLAAKHKFERWARSHGVAKIKSYRADNLPFNSMAWKMDIAAQGQTIDFSGVGAHHQNGVAERSIQTISRWSRAMMIHMVLHWPDSASPELWPFAMEHAVYIWNSLPERESGIAPLELLTRTRFPDHHALLRLHVFGCPTYTLDPKLQDGKKLPKWTPRSRRGIYLGFSPIHSSSVARVLNPRTGNVSPQYHFVCDDHFSTVPNVGTGGIELAMNDQVWYDIVQVGYENDVQDIFGDGDTIPNLQEEWLSEAERAALQHQRQAIVPRRAQQSSTLPGGNTGNGGGTLQVQFSETGNGGETLQVPIAEIAKVRSDTTQVPQILEVVQVKNRNQVQQQPKVGFVNSISSSNASVEDLPSVPEGAAQSVPEGAAPFVSEGAEDTAPPRAGIEFEVSKLQSDIATSTMEAEYNALSMAMRDLLPLRTVFATVGKALGISDDITSSFKTTVHEDNQGCLRLAQKKPGQYTPRSKHYAVKYHWFRSHLSDSTNRTEVTHIDTKVQRADILTKSMPRQSFESIRKLLCGW